MEIAVIARRTLLVGMFGLAAGTPYSSAQSTWPSRIIRLVVPYPPGGGINVIGRFVADRLSKSLGTSVIVENKPGNGGRIGAMAVARAPADGYMLLLGGIGEVVLNPLLEKQPQDPLKDFAPIGILATLPLVVVAGPNIPVKNLKDLIAYAKANPGKVSYGSPGVGTLSHIAIERFKQTVGLHDVVHVPYKGGGAAVQDAMGGQVSFAIVSISAGVIDLHQAGKVRIIATTSQERSEALPDLPSIAEQGFPDLVAPYFTGLLAPVGVPENILNQLEKVTSEAMKDVDVRNALLKAGYNVAEVSRAQAAKLIQEETQRWGPVIRSAGLVQQ